MLLRFKQEGKLYFMEIQQFKRTLTLTQTPTQMRRMNCSYRAIVTMIKAQKRRQRILGSGKDRLISDHQRDLKPGKPRNRIMTLVRRYLVIQLILLNQRRALSLIRAKGVSNMLNVI